MINNFLRFAVLPLTFCFFSVAPSFSTENQFPDSMVYQETKLLLTKSTNGDIQSISSQIDKLLNSFNDKVSVGDIFDFIYIPNDGITVLKNEEQINSISGLEFKKAFFGVWLSDNPVQENLKKAMLGG